MKQMNKEELIEYFISLLGDNHILEKHISIDEIRKRLDSNIKDVSYGENTNYDAGTKTIRLNNNIDDINVMNTTIIHELLHVITTSYQIVNGIETSKVGLELDQHILEGKNWSQTKNWFYVGEKYRLFGKSQNEGITELLTNEILRRE